MDNYSLKKFLKSPFPIKVLPYLLLLFALLGFLDMSYLTIDHYRHFLPPCTIHGCDLVLTSGYSTILSIPLALLGALYFLLFLILGGVLLTFSSNPQNELNSSLFARTIKSLLFIVSIPSLLVSIVLVGLQAFVLHAFCQYCLFGELMFFLIFDTSWWMYSSFQKES